MATEKIEAVRAMWAPFERLDVSAIDWDAKTIREALQPQFSPDVVIRWTWAGEREYRGRDGVIEALRERIEPFIEYHAEPLDFIEVGDHVLVPNRQWGVGRDSEVPVEIEVTHVYEFRDGLITRYDEYDSTEEALEALGASQGPASG